MGKSLVVVGVVCCFFWNNWVFVPGPPFGWSNDLWIPVAGIALIVMGLFRMKSSG